MVQGLNERNSAKRKLAQGCGFGATEALKALKSSRTCLRKAARVTARAAPAVQAGGGVRHGGVEAAWYSLVAVRLGDLHERLGLVRGGL